MPRAIRENIEDGIYHVFARGNNRQEIYLDDGDRVSYLRLLGATVATMRWGCLSYCLMNNHVHLLIETPEANLSEGMQRLHGRYAQSFNLRHSRTGHLFGGRYGAKRIASDVQLQVTAAYIARNPVAAGLCRTPEQWPWGSYRAVAGDLLPSWVDTEGLLERFKVNGVGPAERFKSFVGIDDGAAPT